MIRLRSVQLALALLVTLAACGSPKRANPLPEELVDRAVVPGVPMARIWGDGEPEDYAYWFRKSDLDVRLENVGIYGREHHYLSVSGGGADGAFGAGLLCGWTVEGSRPEFTLVAGISTGALIAPFAFLGPDYDDELREVYTTYSTKDLVIARTYFGMATKSAVGDTTPMVKKIQKYYDEDMLDAIAEQTRLGRTLLIGTTNLDAGRPVIWNVGNIAESDAPNRVKLFQDVILASAAIPAAFPPVYFEVEVDGQRYDEMHVDGGATSQLFLYPLGIDWAELLDRLEVPGAPHVYVIRNGHLASTYSEIYPHALPIAARTIAALMRTGGFGDMYRTYLAAVRDGLDYNLAYIPKGFDVRPKEAFDRDYMQQLFAEAHRMAREGYPWEKAPPGVETD